MACREISSSDKPNAKRSKAESLSGTMGMKEDMIMRAAAGKVNGMMEPLLEDKDDEDASDDDDTNDDDDDNSHKITAGQRLKMLVGKLTVIICNLCYAVESITQMKNISLTRSLVWDNCRGSGMCVNDSIQWKYCDICHGRADIRYHSTLYL
jgi:Pyruvate/2-oxoacid:ferredoxin oxidoreductase delta subunit